jgi:FtsP/CotA-like multicopper oxidase with cupredoxin domain
VGIQDGAVLLTATPSRTLAGTIAAANPRDLTEPAVRASVDGRLDTTLAARYSPVPVAGTTALAENYENSYPGPTLRFRPGDTVRVRLDNQLPRLPFAAAPAAAADPHHGAVARQDGMENITNLHVHGLHVTPQGNGDNVFVDIHPGQAFQYEYQVPPDHPPGLYWYHPHHHGLVNQQLGFGMAGAIIIEGGLDQVRGIAGLRDRLLVMHALQLQGGTVVPGDRQNLSMLTRTVNGQLNPIIRIQPGETQRWRVANVAANSFLRIRLDGHQLFQIASDGNPWRETVPQDDIVLAPAERVEVLVQCRVPGTFTLRTLAFSQPFINTPDTPLATVICDGPAWVQQPLPTTLLPVPDLRSLPITGNGGQPRIVQFQGVMIDGKRFDPNRVDVTVKLGTLEEWLIVGDPFQIHPFHIHQNPFQVTAITANGVTTPVPLTGEKDTVILPMNGSVRIRTVFQTFVGKFVFHCHIALHEDGGQMLVIEVVP